MRKRAPPRNEDPPKTMNEATQQSLAEELEKAGAQLRACVISSVARTLAEVTRQAGHPPSEAATAVSELWRKAAAHHLAVAAALDLGAARLDGQTAGAAVSGEGAPS